MTQLLALALAKVRGETGDKLFRGNVKRVVNIVNGRPASIICQWRTLKS
jgi:hypothetical protein